MTTYPRPHLGVSGITPTEPDWHVLVLFVDDTETETKGIWGPYTTPMIAQEALTELQQWPLDGYWDVRRLNKFVAAKSGTPADSLMKWTWHRDG